MRHDCDQYVLSAGGPIESSACDELLVAHHPVHRLRRPVAQSCGVVVEQRFHFRLEAQSIPEPVQVVFFRSCSNSLIDCPSIPAAPLLVLTLWYAAQTTFFQIANCFGLGSTTDSSCPGS